MALAETADPSEAGPLVTVCGRRIVVSELSFSGPGRAIGRVTLRIGPEQDGAPTAWAGLSASEARALAHLLLVHARAVEQ